MPGVEGSRVSPALWQKISEHGCQLLSETARFGDGLELSRDVPGITLLANATRAPNYDVMLRINAVKNAMVSELVLRIADSTASARVGAPGVSPNLRERL